MKLKSVPPGGYSPLKCCAVQCSATPVQTVPRGTVFPGSRGDVYLCPSHAHKLAIEFADALPPMQPVPKPEGREGAPAQLQIPHAEKPESLEAETKDAAGALDMIREFTIESQADYDFADEALGDVKRAWKDLEARKKRATSPLNESLAEIRGWFKPVQSFYKEAETILKGKIATAQRELQEKRIASLKDVQSALEAGDQQQVQQAFNEAAQSGVEQSKNITIQKVWKFEIYQASIVPAEYWQLNLGAIEDAVNEHKEATQIPGVRVYTEDRVIRRNA